MDYLYNRYRKSNSVRLSSLNTLFCCMNYKMPFPKKLDLFVVSFFHNSILLLRITRLVAISCRCMVMLPTQTACLYSSPTFLIICHVFIRFLVRHKQKQVCCYPTIGLTCKHHLADFSQNNVIRSSWYMSSVRNYSRSTSPTCILLLSLYNAERNAQFQQPNEPGTALFIEVS